MKNSETLREYRLRIYNRSEKFFQKKVAVKIWDGETSSRKWVLSNFNTWDRFNENSIDTFEVKPLFSKFLKKNFKIQDIALGAIDFISFEVEFAHPSESSFWEVHGIEIHSWSDRSGWSKIFAVKPLSFKFTKEVRLRKCFSSLYFFDFSGRRDDMGLYKWIKTYNL